MATSQLASTRCFTTTVGTVTSSTGRTTRVFAAGPLVPLRSSPCIQELGRASPASASNLPTYKQMHKLSQPGRGQQSVRCAAPKELCVTLDSPKVNERAGIGSSTQQAGGHPGDAYFATDKRPIILFDGVCNMCNKGVNFMLDHDPKGNLRFSALQSEAGRALLRRAGRDPQDITSIVLVEPNKCYIRSEAILHIAQYLHQPLIAFGHLGLIVPGFFRDKFYNVIAYNRYSIMGKRNLCRIGDQRFVDRFVS